MVKVSLDNAQKVDITAKRNDNFNLNIDITDAAGQAVEWYGPPSYGQTGIIIPSYRDVLVFTITDDNYDPILVASSEPLDVNFYGKYNRDPYWTLGAFSHAQAVARTLSKYAGDNVLLETDAYGTTPAVQNVFDGSAGQSHNVVKALQSRFFKHNADSISAIEEISAENLTAGTYIASGRIYTTDSGTTRKSPIQVFFNQQNFNLQAGTYKYTLRSLSQMRRTGNTTGIGDGYVFRDCATWLYGKITINEY